jgi:hypothetical protein
VVSDERRGLFAGSVVLSVIGLVLLVSWFVRGGREWWMLVVGLVVAIAGASVAARARREPGEPPPTPGGVR